MAKAGGKGTPFDGDLNRIYAVILDPYIVLFSALRGGEERMDERGRKEALELLTSPIYKRAQAEMLLFGSEEVVKSFNELTALYGRLGKAGEGAEDRIGRELIKKFGNLIVTMRKSLLKQTGEGGGLEAGDVARTFIRDWED